MSNTGVYMNSTTQKIKSKGYSIDMFLEKVGLSLSSYRRYEKEGNPNHAMLNRLIDELESK
tara:strand:- start:2286 stop:2468 length:183 start_codon:yes stop_codon:yes gene_type:complete